MSTSETRAGERVVDVAIGDVSLTAPLVDGREITVPLAWQPRLLNATPEQRESWQTSGARLGIHWPDIDEDLSPEDHFQGAPAPRKQRAAPNGPLPRTRFRFVATGA